MGRAHQVATAVVASSLLAGCAGGGDAEAGFGVPRQLEIDEVTDAREPINGTVVTEANGCFMLAQDSGATRWIVWPPDAEQGQSGDVVVSGGEEFADGDVITGVGALVTLADLPEGANAESYFGSFGAFCDAGESGVVVLDWLEHAGS